MGYFNPIAYFIKSFIRIFTRKFFWIIFICLGIFLGYLLFNNGVFAESNYQFYTDYFSASDINAAKNKLGSIWDNENYDIFLSYKPLWDSNGTKSVVYFDVSNISSSPDYKYVFNTSGSAASNNSGTWYTHSFNLININGDNFSISSHYEKSILNNNWSDTLGNDSSNGSRWISNICTKNSSSSPDIYAYPIRTHYDIYDSDNNLIMAATNPVSVSPYFITTDTQLQTFDFDYLQINGGTTPYYTEISDGVGGNATLSLKYIYSGVQTNIDLTNYITVNSDNTWSVNIPYNALTNSVIVRNGQEFSYVFTYTPFYGTQEIVSKLNLTYTLTSEEEEQINQDSEKQVQSDILQEQKDINQSLNDSHIDDITSDTLPADNTNDITSDGVNAIFSSIYSAFCTGEAQDIVFPVPFTDKSFTIKPDYVSSMLTSINASFIITLIQTFWWYLISRFIIKDIMDKINKIKSGNIENIETSNIRGDML